MRPGRVSFSPFLLLLPCFLLPAFVAAGAPTDDYGRKSYFLIIDAGSSGSRLRMYIKDGKNFEEFQARPEDVEQFETEPGLSAYAEQPSEAGPSLKGLLAVARRYIPKDAQAETRLWVKATAGLRIVAPSVLRHIFGSVDEYLLNPRLSPFKFVASEVLGGEEEAVFAYLSLNRMLGTVSSSCRDCVGALDMGGASMQIAYKPKGDILANEFSYYVHQQRQSVYAKSYIRFGIDEAMLRLKRKLLPASPSPGTSHVDFPCFNRGYSEESFIDGSKVNFTGSGDSDRCARLSHELLHVNYECMLDPCPMMGVHMSPVTGLRFYAISGYFYVVAGLGLVGWNEAKVVTPRQIELATRSLCNRTRAEALAKSGAPWKYLKGFCFAGHYVRNVLRALGFEDDSTSLTFVRRMPSGASADWTFGAVLYETQYMPLTLSTKGGPCKMEHSACPAAPPQQLPSPDTAGKWQLPAAVAALERRQPLPLPAASAGDAVGVARGPGGGGGGAGVLVLGLAGACLFAFLVHFANRAPRRSAWQPVPLLHERPSNSGLPLNCSAADVSPPPCSGELPAPGSSAFRSHQEKRSRLAFRDLDVINSADEAEAPCEI